MKLSLEELRTLYFSMHLMPSKSPDQDKRNQELVLRLRKHIDKTESASMAGGIIKAASETPKEPEE